MEPNVEALRHTHRGCDTYGRQAVTRRTVGTVMAAAALVAFAGGCSKSTEGAATPSTTDASAAAAALWDPCTQIDGEILRKVGVDQSTRESGIGGVQQTGWKICSWMYPPEHSESITVYSTIHTIDEFKKKPENSDFESIAINGRSGVKYMAGLKNDTCNIAFPVNSGGSLEISFENVDPAVTADPCVGASNAAKNLVPIFPR